MFSLVVLILMALPLLVQPSRVEATSEYRYILFGMPTDHWFNFRREVYIRLVTFIRSLPDYRNWTVVLPPWSRKNNHALKYWNAADSSGQLNLPWTLFFDLSSMNEHIRVLDHHDFLREVGVAPVQVEAFYALSMQQKCDSTWKNPYERNEYGIYPENQFVDYHSIFFKGQIVCVYIESKTVSTAVEFLCPLILGETARVVYIDRAVDLRYGFDMSKRGIEFWLIRRSMRFASHLRAIGDDFRSKFLDSRDEDDGTILCSKWKDCRPMHGDARGGAYLSAHVRRTDKGGMVKLPSLAGTAKRINRELQRLRLKKVFIATDCPKEEFDELSSMIRGEVFKFRPSDRLVEEIKDGGVVIVEQWIAAHATYFLGTKLSTVSFRIAEEREILGFKSETSFYEFCEDKVEFEDCSHRYIEPIQYENPEDPDDGPRLADIAAMEMKYKKPKKEPQTSCNEEL